jgi:hypothetical protein
VDVIFVAFGVFLLVEGVFFLWLRFSNRLPAQGWLGTVMLFLHSEANKPAAALWFGIMGVFLGLFLLVVLLLDR